MLMNSVKNNLKNFSILFASATLCSLLSSPALSQTTPTQPTETPQNSPTTPNTNTRPGTNQNTPTTPNTNTQPGTNQNSNSTLDQNFLRQAAQINLLEVQLGQLATQRAASPAVRQYAQRIIQDHTQATTQLQQLARQNGATLPTSVDAQSTALVNQLTRLSGADFDAAYLREMINSHNQAIALFQRQAQQGQSPEMRVFATNTLPLLRQHLELARQITPQSGQTGSPQSTQPGQGGVSPEIQPGQSNVNQQSQVEPEAYQLW